MQASLPGGGIDAGPSARRPCEASTTKSPPGASWSAAGPLVPGSRHLLRVGPVTSLASLVKKWARRQPRHGEEVPRPPRPGIQVNAHFS